MLCRLQDLFYPPENPTNQFRVSCVPRRTEAQRKPVACCGEVITKWWKVKGASWAYRM